MLFSLAVLLLFALAFSAAAKWIRLPGLIGMIITGIVLGPWFLDIIDPSILSVSADIRRVALIIILTRAGLSLDWEELKKVGRPALLLSFLPAGLEICAYLFFAPVILSVSMLEAAILGTVIAAVSPAVIVPRMISLMESGYGKDKQIPQMIMAGASVDDVFVIVLFTSFLTIAGGGSFSAMGLVKVPLSVLIGILAGFACGYSMSVAFKKIHMRDTVKVLLLLCLSVILMALEDMSDGFFPFSGLISVMALGMAMLRWHPMLSGRLSMKYSQMWVVAELLLFTLVGAAVDLRYAAAAGLQILFVLFLALAFRMLGVLLSLTGTKLNKKERLFCMIAYCPKATVQAAIGSVPLAMGLPCGRVVLTGAVLSILITAPLGALLLDRSSHRLLSRME